MRVRVRVRVPPQLLRYTFPFMFISAVFWLLHTWLLDPMPNGFKRQEFLRYRREMMHVASKLNFRSPAREVGGLACVDLCALVYVWVCVCVNV